MPGRLVVQQTDGGRHIIESPHVKAPSARAGVAFPGESRWSSHLDKNGFPIQIVTCVAVIRAILQTHELAPVHNRSPCSESLPFSANCMRSRLSALSCSLCTQPG